MCVGGARVSGILAARDDEYAPEASPACLEVGAEAEHDLLGTGKVLAIASTETVAAGVVVTFEPAYNNKVLFSFVKKVKRKYQTFQRWVFEDALTPAGNTTVNPDDSATTPTNATDTPTAFREMTERAREQNAFTQGMSPPERAAHERARKTRKLKDAPVRGRNRSERKTKEPKVDPANRVADFPHQSLGVDNDKVFCKACTKQLSLRRGTIAAHVNSKSHEKNMEICISTLSDDDQIRLTIAEYFDNHPDEALRTITPDVHLLYRWRVAETMLYAGVPMAKIDMLRKLLEREGHALTAAAWSHVRNIHPTD